MKHKKMTKPAAYDMARREFYQHRHLADIRRRIAREEALHVGAYFGKGPLEIGMGLEDKSWEDWKAWAGKQIEDEQQARAQMFSGPQTDEPALSTGEFDAALDEVQSSVPESSQGQSAVHP